jgi:hypothetical protein
MAPLRDWPPTPAAGRAAKIGAFLAFDLRGLLSYMTLADAHRNTASSSLSRHAITACKQHHRQPGVLAISAWRVLTRSV